MFVKAVKLYIKCVHPLKEKLSQKMLNVKSHTMFSSEKDLKGHIESHRDVRDCPLKIQEGFQDR